MPPWALGITTMLCVQLANALSIDVAQQVGAAGTAWLRMCFGTVFIWILARPALRGLRRRDIPAVVVLGAATGLMTVFFLAAVERIPLGTAVAIEFLGPLTVAALTSRGRRTLIWPVLALAGVVLLTQPWQGEFDLLGSAFALFSGACWGLYNVLTQYVGDRFSGISGLALTFPIAVIATMPLGLPQVVGGALSWSVLAAAAGIALLTPVLAFGLEMLALRRMTQTAYGTLLSIEPALGLLIGLVVLAQVPGPLQLAGIGIVIAAGAAAQRGGARGPIGELC